MTAPFGASSRHILVTFILLLTFKLKCVDLYRQGMYPETPEGLTDRRFHSKVREWVRIEESCGIEALKHKNQNKEWTAEQRYELVAQVIAGKSNKEVALSNGISPGQLYQWVRKYKELGYNGLETLKKGRPVKESEMKKNVEKNHSANQNEKN